MRKKKTYSVWNNCRYAFFYLRQKKGMRAYGICGGDIFLSVLLPFLEAALAGAMAACLVSGRGPEVILLMIAGYIIFLQAARFLQGQVRSVRNQIMFLFRLRMVLDFSRKMLEMDGQSLESAGGQNKREAAERNLCSGNSVGIEAYTIGFCDLFLNLSGLLAYSVVVGRASLFLLILMILQTALTSYIHFLAGKRAYKMEDEVEENWSNFRYLRRESILPDSGKDIRIYRMDQWFLKVFDRFIQRIVTLLDKEQTGYMGAGMAEKLLSFARNLIVYGWLIREMGRGNITVPAFLLYVGVVAGFETWMNGLFGAMQQIYQNEKAMDEYREFMDFGDWEETEEGPASPGALHEIRLENVSFRYEENDSDTIHCVNLTIHPGERLALVGLNGAGKTTLIKIICGLYRPTSGTVYLDGKDMRAMSRREIFREYAVVFQEVFAFAFPLVENVSCRKKGEEDTDKLWESLEKAGLAGLVEKLPRGAETVMNKELDEEGVTLSGGEMQKLMLARALYKDAPIVILDEPTAALDPIAESGMYEKYDEMIREKTAVFISHRLSSTRFCDRILFLENGRITEEGTHGELMQRGGAYAELFSVQARYYKEQKTECAATL